MPFCDDCDRFYNPNTLASDGSCPEGHEVAEPTPTPTVPWHFKLMLSMVVAYLGWRFIQLIQAIV